MFDYKEYLKPLQKWLEELEEQGINQDHEKKLTWVPFEVYETIGQLLENYIWLREHKDEK